MKDLVDEKRDECQKSTRRNLTTPKRAATTVAGEVHGLEHIDHRSCVSASRAEATLKERTRGRAPRTPIPYDPCRNGEATPKERTKGIESPTDLSYDPCRNREGIPNVYTFGMAQSNYGRLVPASLGRLANEHIQSMSQSVTRCSGSPAKSSATATESPRNTDPFASGSLESATGYQSFFKKRNLERSRPTDPPLANTTSVRHVANEHSQKSCWQDRSPLEHPKKNWEILEPREGNEHQSRYSPPGALKKAPNILNQFPAEVKQPPNNSDGLLMEVLSTDPHPGPPSRMCKIPMITSKVNASATAPIELPIRYRPVHPHPGPPSRIFKVPKATPRVKTSATNPLKRPMEYRPANPPPGHSTRPRMFADVVLQRIAAAAHLALESSTSPPGEVNEHLQGRDHIANLSPSRTVAAGTIPPPLPPSVEEAYKKKCIELKRRMQDVEESNDVFRVRKARLARGIRKMRLERAYLLEMLGKRMKKNGNSADGFPLPYDEESDGSSEGPPTVFVPSSCTCRPSPVKSLAN